MPPYVPGDCADDTFGCDNNLPLDQKISLTITTDANGCPAIRVTGISGGGGSGDASAANQVAGNLTLDDILTRLNAIMPTGTETPSASSVGVGAGSVAAGKVSVTFTTDSAFTGTILGVARSASTTYSFSISNPGKTLSAIAYNVTAGTVIIDVTV